jgi:hypothetical protein
MSVPTAELYLSDIRAVLSYDSPYRMSTSLDHIYYSKYGCG